MAELTGGPINTRVEYEGKVFEMYSGFSQFGVPLSFEPKRTLSRLLPDLWAPLFALEDV